jgi:hypothetical protein
VTDQQTAPRLDGVDTDGNKDVSHYARKEEIGRAAVDGGLVTALCGVKFAPVRDPQRFPVCQRCAQLFGQLGNIHAS